MRYTSFLGLILLCSCSTYQEHSLTVCVDARHLDYKDGQAFINSMIHSPDYGHAWVCLRANDSYFEGGHSGELGMSRARYFDGIMNNIEFGHSNPTKQQIARPAFEANPIKYLWENQIDGYLERKSGGHSATYAIKVPITPEQYARIRAFIRNYDFKEYSITGNQCCYFVSQIAAIADLELDDVVTMRINQFVELGGEKYKLWTDPQYSIISFSSPDILERSMKKAVKEGRAIAVSRHQLSRLR